MSEFNVLEVRFVEAPRAASRAKVGKEVIRFSRYIGSPERMSKFNVLEVRFVEVPRASRRAKICC